MLQQVPEDGRYRAKMMRWSAGDLCLLKSACNRIFCFFSFMGWGETESTRYCGHCFGLLYQLRMRDDDDCGAIGGMRIGRGNRGTWRKPDSVSLCPPQIPHDLTWARTRTAAVGSQRLTA
jgi:hypothetical protein